MFENCLIAHAKSAKSFDNCLLSDVCEAEIFYENDIYAFGSIDLNLTIINSEVISGR